MQTVANSVLHEQVPVTVQQGMEPLGQMEHVDGEQTPPASLMPPELVEPLELPDPLLLLLVLLPPPLLLLLPPETQLPPRQTMFVPHAVPSGSTTALPHVCTPVEHVVVPATHGLAVGLQARPAVHATQVPVLSQTMLVPHGVPGDAAAVCLQTDAPVVQSV